MDTSILLTYTLVQAAEPKRYQSSRRLIEHLIAGSLPMITSFYALHEIFLFALEQAPNEEIGNSFGKAALAKILSLPVRLLPLLSRYERMSCAKKFAVLSDHSDIQHAISAYLSNCRVIIAYDEHFRKLPTPLIYKTPEELLEKLKY